MRDEWEGPAMGYALLAAMMMPLLLIVAFAALLRFDLEDPAAKVPILLLTYASILNIALYGDREFDERHRSQRRPLAMGPQEARTLVEQALAASGLSATERPPAPDSKSTVWDVKGGITVRLFEGEDRCYVYVGPASDSTRRDVEGLKRAIDAALPRAKGEGPGPS